MVQTQKYDNNTTTLLKGNSAIAGSGSQLLAREHVKTAGWFLVLEHMENQGKLRVLVYPKREEIRGEVSWVHCCNRG